MKKAFVIIVVTLFAIVSLAGCSRLNILPAATNKLTIVATLFPQYDFARAITGNKADVRLLLAPGTESHSYEPTPADIIAINSADVFIYTGKYQEAWAERIISSLTSTTVAILDVSEGIELMHDDHDHDHDHEGEHEDDEHHDEEEHEEDDEHDDEHEDDEHHDEEEHADSLNPHIWTDPVIAQAMVNNIAETLCYIDPENAVYYKKNAEAYKAELAALDAQFASIVASGVRKEVFFGGRFALHYFVERYELDYEAAYPNCTGETEPSAQVIAHIIDEMREHKIPVIYYEELVDPKVARIISEATGAEMLLFHSCHNVSRDDFNKGATYITLMKQNALNLQKGLK